MFKGKNVDARQIGERLKVRTLLEGSLRKAGDRIRMSVQLINASDGYQLWSHTYERTLADVFALQDELTRAIVCELTSRVVVSTSEPVVRVATDLPEAYELYLQGCYFRNKQTTEGFSAAIDHFRRRDRTGPRLCRRLRADGVLLCPGSAWTPSGHGSPGGDAAARRPPSSRRWSSIPCSRRPTAPRRVIAALYDWDWRWRGQRVRAGAGSRCKILLFHIWHALFLSAMGRHDESLRVVTWALARSPIAGPPPDSRDARLCSPVDTKRRS